MVRWSDTKRDFGSGMLAKFEVLERRSGLRLEILQKILLAETGTLEQVLSIISREVVSVKIVEQGERNGIVSRESTISTESGRILVKARSKIYARNAPKKVMQFIRAKNFGIGTIIQNLELETFRKITEIGYDPRTANLFRKYQIMIARKLCFEIREEFVN